MVTTVSLEGFVAALRAIPEEEFTNRRVLETVTNSRVPITELDPYLVWKPDRYTRSLIYRNEVFEVIVLCWNVGQGSPVHDHAGQRCWMTLPQGRLEITNYSYKDGREIEFIDAEIVGEHESDVHVDQCCSVHQITNRCAWCEPAVSLQVRSPRLLRLPRPLTELWLSKLFFRGNCCPRSARRLAQHFQVVEVAVFDAV